MKSGYCTIMSNGRDHRTSKINHHQPSNAGLHSKKMMCIWWDWKGVLYHELLQENQMINSNKYFSQLDQLKAALSGKCPELVNRKRIIFHRDNTRSHVSLKAYLGSSNSSSIFT